MADRRRGSVAFPIGNRGFVNADAGGNLRLEEFEVQAPFADVVA
jgi:hypothetical protein